MVSLRVCSFHILFLVEVLIFVVTRFSNAMPSVSHRLCHLMRPLIHKGLRVNDPNYG
jgi:hypothetical protein